MAVLPSRAQLIDQLSSSSDDDMISLPPVKAEPKVSKPQSSQKKRKVQPPSPSMLSDLSSEEEPTEEERLAAARVQRRRRCNKEQQLYSMKYKLLKQAAKSMIYENLALAKRVETVQKSLEKEIQERNFLLSKLLDYQSKGIKPARKTAKVEKRGKKETKVTKKKTLKPQSRGRKSLSPALPMLHSPSMSLGSDNQDIWSPRAISGRSEGGPKGKKGPVRRIQAIPLTKDGTPVFPIVIGTLKVLDLGKIVYDRPAFHSDRYLLPAGYTSVRIYPSIQTPSQKCEYTCRITDAGEAPLFEMVAEDDPDNPVRASSSSQCHAQVLKAINKARGKIATNTGSGPDFFGYGNPTIMNLIQKLPNAEKCTKYKRVSFEASNRMAKGSNTKGTKTSKATAKATKTTPEVHNTSIEDDSSLLGTPTLGLSPFENSSLLFPTHNSHFMDFSLSSSPSMMDSDGSSDSESLADSKQMTASSSFM